MIRLAAAVAAAAATAALVMAPSPAAAAASPCGRVIFADTFSGSHLSSAWTPGWFGTGVTGPVNSGEDAAYRSSQVSVSGGNLNLALNRRNVTSNGVTYPWTGSIVTTSGSFSFTYGCAEARIWMPSRGGQLLGWQVFMTLGRQWPADGEDDILETLGAAKHYYHSSSWDGASGSAPWVTGGWHTFESVWTPGSVTYYCDGRNTGTVSGGIASAPEYLAFVNTVNHRDGKPASSDVMRVAWVTVRGLS